MRTLVTNDDGIDSPGLHRLAAAARDTGLDVVVAAPAEQSSGSSAAITAGVDNRDRIALEHRTLVGLEDVPAFAVGAALTAGLNGCRGLAVSLDVGLEIEWAIEQPTADPHWATAAEIACRVVPFLAKQPDGTVLNLNVPDVEPGRVAGLREAPLAEFGIVQTTMTERDDDHIRLTVSDNVEVPVAGTDAAVVAAGYAVLTAIRSVCETDQPSLRDLVDPVAEQLPMAH